MHYTIEKITALTGAHFYGPRLQDSIDWLLTDSRSLSFPETTLFFALRTRLGDGHIYIDDLYRRGVRNFVVGTLPADFSVRFPEANFLLVVSPLKALQRLAERHREEFDIPVVGITGSNGKTIVKEWLAQLLMPSMNITRSPRSFNSQIGVPLSVCLLNSRTKVGIFEAGISQTGEMAALESIIQPTIGLITNIGQAHQENFATLEEKCLEKLLLFKHAELLIFNADDDIISRCIASISFKGKTLAWSQKDASATLFISHVEKTPEGMCINYTYQGRQHVFAIPFYSESALQNTIHCLAVCLALGLSPEEIAARMPRLEAVAMRLEVKQGERGLTLVNDSYNSDLTSLDIALDFTQRQFASQKKPLVLILSDISQSGMPDAELYEMVNRMAVQRGVSQIIGVGQHIAAAHSLFEIKKKFFQSTEELLQSNYLSKLSDAIILLKGGRSFNFENITETLALKLHETTLEIDLEAVAANLNHYRSFMQPQTKMVCMIKANAYGTGSIALARTLQDRGVDYLAVAVADEGAELRKAGITANIIVMNPELSSFHTLFEHRLEPEVYNMRMLEALIHAAKTEGITNWPVHIKIDTGMHRLGFHPTLDLPVLKDRLLHQSALIPRSVFSHFVGSDSPDFDTFSQQQYDLFIKAANDLQRAFPHKILRHICNSAAIERFPERHLDMVRLGIGLYGVSPVDNSILNNVATLHTTILQIRDVKAGESIGYSRRGVAETDSRIAAIPIGYADGLNRKLGNRNGYCLVNGQPARYMGNICMDVALIDVTGIDCCEGDRVEIFGSNLPVTTIAQWLDTIPYEILTSVSERVRRIYTHG